MALYMCLLCDRSWRLWVGALLVQQLGDPQRTEEEVIHHRVLNITVAVTNGNLSQAMHGMQVSICGRVRRPTTRQERLWKCDTVLPQYGQCIGGRTSPIKSLTVLTVDFVVCSFDLRLGFGDAV